MKRIAASVLAIVFGVILFSSCEPRGFDPANAITIIAREDGSGTKTAFTDMLDLSDKPDPRNVIIQSGTAAVLNEVRTNPNALAYESLGYVTDSIKVISIDGYYPTAENIMAGSYTLARPFAVIFRPETLDIELNAEFLEFLQSAEAQEIITNEGYVATLENPTRFVATGSFSGEIEISGSTSVQPLMNELGIAFREFHPGAMITVGGGGSGTGYNNIENRVSDFGMISDVFDQTRGPSAQHLYIALDGIAIIVHLENPLANITLEQLRAIYNPEDDSIRFWNQLVDVP